MGARSPRSALSCANFNEASLSNSNVAGATSTISTMDCFQQNSNEIRDACASRQVSAQQLRQDEVIVVG